MATFTQDKWQDEIAAILEGVETYGIGRWKEIKAAYPVALANLSADQIRVSEKRNRRLA